MAPEMLLKLLFLVVVLFSFFYMIAVKWPKKAHGIQCVFEYKSKQKRFLVKLFSPQSSKATIIYLMRFLSVSIRFSLLSVFRIGWRELNLGNWIARMLFRRYTLEGIGWVRFVSALQSIFSLYFVALWILTYFGRPFE